MDRRASSVPAGLGVERGRHHRLVAVGAAAVLLLSLAATHPTRAASLPVGLANEYLAAANSPFGDTANPFANADCHPEGTSTVSFDVAGTAQGSYPGTFEETGTASFGAQDPASLRYVLGPLVPGQTSQWFNIGLSSGAYVSIDAAFTIHSGTTTIHGTKHLDGVATIQGRGVCQAFSNNNTNLFLSNAYGTSVLLSYGAVTYDAIIQTPSGAYHDSGTARIEAQVTDSHGTATYPYTTHVDGFIAGWSEFFMTSNGVTAAGPAAVTVTPAAATNPVGTSHTVTATVTDAGGGAVSGGAVLFSVTGATAASGSCTTDPQGTCQYTYQGPTHPGSDTITACADSDDSGTADLGEPCGSATKTWVAGPATAVALDPASAVNHVGTSHTVTATTTDAYGNPVSTSVLFTVTGAVNTSGSCSTDANGQCSFTYSNPSQYGFDTITACADNNGNEAADADEPCGSATKLWTNPPANADQCKQGGWASSTDEMGRPFKNQGDCVSYVSTGGRNTPAG